MVATSEKNCSVQTSITRYDALVLVHGTFGRDSAWTRPESPFVSRLTKDLHVPVLRFAWSGVNSHRARLNAGVELATFVSELHSKGHRRLCVIAHSHGGNVVLYALRNKCFQAAVNGIIFLGTPFLWIVSRPVERFSRVLAEIASWLLLFPGLMPYGFLLSVTIATYVAGDIGGGVMLFFGNTIIMLLYLFLRPKLQRFTRRLLGDFLKRKQKEIKLLLHQSAPDCEAMVIFIERDEAEIFLRLVDYASVAPWVIVDYLSRMVAALVIAFLVNFLHSSFIYGGTINELDE